MAKYSNTRGRRGPENRQPYWVLSNDTSRPVLILKTSSIQPSPVPVPTKHVIVPVNGLDFLPLGSLIFALYILFVIKRSVGMSCKTPIGAHSQASWASGFL